jgi:hypothetical protein
MVPEPIMEPLAGVEPAPKGLFLMKREENLNFPL